jgi:hypothetical protein
MQANDMADMEETGSQPVSYVELSGHYSTPME